METRKHLRVEAVNLLSYSLLDADGQVVRQGMGRTLNVSEGGIRLETHIPLKRDDALLLSIGFHEELIHVRGKVVHAALGAEGRYESGISFQMDETDEATLAVLRKYIQIFQKEEVLLQDMGIDIALLNEPDEDLNP